MPRPAMAGVKGISEILDTREICDSQTGDHFGTELQVVEPPVEPAGLNQFLVRTAPDDLAVLDLRAGASAGLKQAMSLAQQSQRRIAIDG
jgi:hypothetical protein